MKLTLKDKKMDTNFNYRGYYIVVNRKANKNIYFRMRRDGTISLNCPYNTKEKHLLLYLDEFINKLENKNFNNDYIKYEIIDGGYIYILDHKYTLNYIKSEKEYVKIEDDTLYLYLKEEDNASKVIDKYLKQEATKLFTPLFEEIVNEFNHIDFIPTLKIRKMTSKFGVCFYKKEAITLSTILMHYDYDCIRYVIVHELAHFVHPNHSKQFYYLVEKYVPNYKEIMKRLRGYQ
ncbi:MAG: SprT family zinc-dependent metalloprotease [Erysipelotrichales bacterium]